MAIGRFARALTGDRIARITPAVAKASRAAGRVIAGEGRVLAPGFIDLHTHGDPLDWSYETYLAMGVTTVVLGQDGSGPRIGKDSDLAAGASGLSYGLEYVPGIYAQTTELATLGRVVCRHGGVVMGHMRSENDCPAKAGAQDRLTWVKPKSSDPVLGDRPGRASASL